MKKGFAKSLLSLILVILMVFPTVGLASNESDTVIKSVYFQDEDGNMVLVDYSRAIEESLKGDHTFYNAVKHYAGIAEVKGKPVYLELSNGKVLDYSLAMLDNLFKLAEVIDKEKYEVNIAIKCTHELKIVDGKPVIVEIKEDIDSNYTISIEGPKTLELGETASYDLRAYGDGKGNVNYRAKYEYKVTGGTGTLEYLDGDTWKEIPLSGNFGPDEEFTLTPDWDLTTKIRFTPDNEGTYSIGLSLKDLDKNKILADAEHTFVVNRPIEEPKWPIEVESVFVGNSEVTNNTYANIKIKDEYVSFVKAVYVDDEPANNMGDNPAQWRIQVADGTKAEDLKGRISIISVDKGRVLVALWKDKESDRTDFNVIKDSFYLKNKKTKEEFREGDIPWNAKNSYQMKDIPEGEYTVHFDLSEGLYIEEIRMGGAYDYTIYDPETNPFVVRDLGKSNNNIRISLRANTKLKEIKELDITLPNDTSYEEFLKIRPNRVIVVDENDEEYEVEAIFDPNKFNYNAGVSKGTLRVQSNTPVILPLNVSNTVPPMRKYAYLNITFVDPGEIEKHNVNFHLLARLTDAGKGNDEILLDPTIKVKNTETQEVQTFIGTSVDLEPGTYEYTINVLGYEEKSGSFTLTNESLEIREEYIPSITVTYKDRGDGNYDWKVSNPVNLGIKEQGEQYPGYRLQFVDTSVGAHMPTPIYTAFGNAVKVNEKYGAPGKFRSLSVFINFEQGKFWGRFDKVMFSEEK